MARAKPSDWKPAGIEILDVSGLYSDADLQEMVGAIGQFPIDRREIVAAGLLNIAALLNADLHYDRRPTPSQKRVALEPIAKKLNKLRTSLAALDSDAVAALEAAAGREAPDPQTEPADLIGGVGDIRYAAAVEGLARLAAWAAAALDDLPATPKGRKPDDAAREAAFRLLSLWQAHGREPSIGPFLGVLRCLAGPVAARHGLAPDLETVAKAVLYRGWQPAGGQD